MTKAYKYPIIWLKLDRVLDHDYYHHLHLAIIAILRMSTLDGQENVLAFKEHKINGVSFIYSDLLHFIRVNLTKQKSDVLASKWSYDQSKPLGIFFKSFYTFHFCG